jgi:hypothetical protein
VVAPYLHEERMLAAAAALERNLDAQAEVR